MELTIKIIQVVIALFVLKVWLVTFGRESGFRGGEAKSLAEEFEVYGLPSWLFYLVGFLKVTCSLMLIAGLWYPALQQPAAIGLAVLMLGAVSMHVKVGDPLKKSLPSLTLLVLSLVVAFA